MGFNDEMSDEEKKLMLGRVQSEQSPEQELPVQSEMANITPIKGFNDQYNDQTPSYASQHVSPDVSQALNANESNIDSQQAAKQAALEKLIAQSGTLTPMNQKIAEGMGGMGSIKNVAAKALPLAERASAPFLQKTGPEAKTFKNIEEQYTYLQNTAKDLRNKAMQLWESSAHSPEAINANRDALSAELTFNKAKNRFNGNGYSP